MAVLPGIAEAHTASITPGCTGVTFKYQLFKSQLNTTTETISMDGKQIYSGKYQFQGSSSTHTVPITVSQGSHHVDGHASWNLDVTGSADSGNVAVSGCNPPPTHLAFATQPTDAQVGKAITGTANTPSGPPVAVDLLDANGNLTSSTAPVTITLSANPGGASLAGTTTVNAAGGVASFSNLTLSKPGYGYKLAAASSGVAGTDSSSFNEFDVSSGTTCNENVDCTGTATDASTQGSQSSQTLSATATFDPNNPDAGQLEVALNRSQAYWTAHAAQCGNYSFLRADTDVVFMTASTRGKQFTDTLTVPAVNFGALGQLVNQQQYCLVAPYPFTSKSGPAAATTQPDGTPGYIGLLADCANVTNQPCISARNSVLNGLFGTVSITITIPPGEPGDPQGRG